MTEKRWLDLAKVSLDLCRALVGQEFVRRNDDGPDVVLRLATAEPVGSTPAGDKVTDRPFSLLFSGPEDPQLTQGMHDLDHPDQGLPGIFLVPVGRDDAGMKYEAIFT